MAAGTFSELSIPAERLRSFPQTYPGIHLLPGGDLFYSRTGFGSAGPVFHPGDPTPDNAYFRLTGPTAGEWVGVADTMDMSNRVKGMSVTLLLGPLPDGSYVTKVMVVGGNGSDTAETINLSTSPPAWEAATTVPGGGRSNVNVVLLPDNTVFVCGGASPTDVGVLPCALYDPLAPPAQAWQSMDALGYRRAYHSVALLLPTGQVMCTGDSNQLIEVFDPPYLFGDRPEIRAAPPTVHHGQEFEVESPQAESIERVVLVRPMAVTHQTDSEQRVISLRFTRDGGRLRVTAPNGSHPHPVAPRGYYMLFILTTQGVPSVACRLYLH